MSDRQRQWLRLAAIEVAILAIGLGSLVLLDYALEAALDAGLLAVGIGLAVD